jgi:hypothetical protein
MTPSGAILLLGGVVVEPRPSSPLDLVLLGENLDPPLVVQRCQFRVTSSLVALHLELLVCLVLLVSLEVFCTSGVADVKLLVGILAS